MEIIQPPDWQRPKGYSNGIITTGKMFFVAGQVGWNKEEQFETDDFCGQARQALTNIKDILTAGGAGPEHMRRMTWYIGDKDEYNGCLGDLGKVYQEVMGKNFPVMTGIQVAGFVEEGAKLEIEVTAVVPE